MRGLALALTLIALPAMAEELRIGTEADYPPYMAYGADGELQGFDRDLGEAICDYLRADCLWTVGAFDGLLTALAAGDHDLVIAAISATPARREIVDFSTPYASGGISYAVYGGLNPNANPVTARIGVQAGTIQAEHLAGQGRDIVTYPTTEAALEAVMRREVDLVFTSDLVLRQAVETRFPGLRRIGEEVITTSDTAVAVAKGRPDLRDRISAAIEALIEDGTISRLESRWFVAGTRI